MRTPGLWERGMYEAIGSMSIEKYRKMYEKLVRTWSL